MREGQGEEGRDDEDGIGCIFNQRELAFPCSGDKEGGSGREGRWVGE